MRLQVGTIQAASYASGSNPLDPENIQTDWDGVAIPAGWTLDLGNATYTATGMYCTDSDGLTTDPAFHTFPINKPITALSVVIAYTINAYGDGFIQTVVAEPSNGFLARFNTETTTPASEHYLPLNTPTFVPEALLATDTTGLVIVAMTLFQDGSRVAYRFDDNGITASPYVGATFNASVLPAIEISTHNFDFNNEVEGTPGDFRLLHTYVGMDEELDQAAIQTIAEGWGWVMPLLPPAALSGSVGWWEAADYTSGNLVNKGTTGAALDLVMGGTPPTLVDGTLVFGGTATMSCANHADLNVAEGEPLSVGVILTLPQAPLSYGHYMSKFTWLIASSNLTLAPYTQVRYGAGDPSSGALSALDVKGMFSVVSDGVAERTYTNATGGTSHNVAQALTGTDALRFGDSPNGGQPQRFIFHAAFVYLGTLDVDDLTEICAYYGVS